MSLPWEEILTFVQEHRQHILLGISVPMLGYSLVQLLPKPGREKEAHREVALEELAKRTVGWASASGDKRTIDIIDLVKYWREPQDVLSEGYTLQVRHKKVREFYNECVLHAYWFQDRNKLSHKAVIIQILELLDSYHTAPSVMRNTAVETDTDRSWDKKSFAVLSEVTLLEHSINACELGIAHLISTKQQHRIPDAMIALLAHDIGKLPGLEQKSYATGEHPVNSHRLLMRMKYFEAVPRSEEIGQAVLGHHQAEAKANSLTSVVKEADRAARKAEFEEIGRKNIIPAWIAGATIPDRRLVYAGTAPASDAGEKEIEVLFRPPPGEGVLGEMKNFADLASVPKGVLQKDQEKPVPSPATDQEKSVEEVVEEPEVDQISVAAAKGVEAIRIDEQPRGGFLPEAPEVDEVPDTQEGEGRGAADIEEIPAEKIEEASQEVEPTLPEAEQVGVNDPKWEQALLLVESEDGEFDVAYFRERLVIGKNRAQAILDAMLEQGILSIPESIEEEPVAPTESSTTPAPREEEEIPLPEEPPTSPENSDDAPAPGDDEDYGERTVYDPPPAPILSENREQAIPRIQIGTWFNAGQLARRMKETIDKTYRWEENGSFPPTLIDMTGKPKTANTMMFAYSQHDGTAWVVPRGLRRLVAPQLAEVSTEQARALFYETTGGGDRELQDAILLAIVAYFQETGSIRLDLLPEGSPFYSVPCTIFTKEGTNLGVRRMIPFKLFDFYANWEEAKKRREKNNTPVHAIKPALPGMESSEREVA